MRLLSLIKVNVSLLMLAKNREALHLVTYSRKETKTNRQLLLSVSPPPLTVTDLLRQSHFFICEIICFRKTKHLIFTSQPINESDSVFPSTLILYCVCTCYVRCWLGHDGIWFDGISFWVNNRFIYSFQFTQVCCLSWFVFVKMIFFRLRWSVDNGLCV